MQPERLLIINTYTIDIHEFTTILNIVFHTFLIPITKNMIDRSNQEIVNTSEIKESSFSFPFISEYAAIKHSLKKYVLGISIFKIGEHSPNTNEILFESFKSLNMSTETNFSPTIIVFFISNR